MASQSPKQKPASAVHIPQRKSSERILAEAIHAAEELGEPALLHELAAKLDPDDLTHEQWRLVATTAIENRNITALWRAGKEIDFTETLPISYAGQGDSLVSPEDGWLALALSSDADIFEYLRAAGSPTQPEDGEPLLIVACKFNADPAVFDAALDISDVNAVDENGRTPLMWLALSGSTKNARALLRAGVDANLLDDEKRSALFYALHLDHRAPEDVRIFVSDVARSSNPALLCGDGMTAIEVAAAKARWAMIDVLCSVWGVAAAEEAARATMKTLMPHAAQLLAVSEEQDDLRHAMRADTSAQPSAAIEAGAPSATKTHHAQKAKDALRI